ncbi:hypothetical protein BDN72DRAFT_763531 [Pluteus cervinus]|uniref:Uncharacterized protein n=1 Tax=Pluteus cervinus TaxID=181527 RepID=A0ACD3B2K0_9AGAR|nr:hypothetical protein BDN72DRAFT_763531 [Pluteus cervinus]
MLGSAKINGLVGHTGLYGDRFSKVQGAKASTTKGSKAQYYPLAPPANHVYNPERPESYNLDALPLRTQDEYWKTIETLDCALTNTARKAITKQTGVSRLPLCATSPGFVHPSFFPLDPFHLFYENCMAFIWDLWTLTNSDEVFCLSSAKAREFGRLIPEAMSTLPPIFSGPVRDPFLKRQSQYKMYEWMALLHWYIIPIGLELGFSLDVLTNFAYFVQVVEFAMTPRPYQVSDLQNLQGIIKKFFKTYEQLYIGHNPENISRSRLCIFQLAHVPIHIYWNGSIRVGSQATVERSIGEMGHKIRSKKAPFANLATLIFEREQIRLLKLYQPSLKVDSKSQTDSACLYSKMNIELTDPSIQVEVQLLNMWMNQHFPGKEFEFNTWGKARLKDKQTLQSTNYWNSTNKSSRRYTWFEVRLLHAFPQDIGGKFIPVFGEALNFYTIHHVKDEHVVVFRPLTSVHEVLGTWRGTWALSIQIMSVQDIVDLVGTWSYESSPYTYMLRKHPAFTQLTSAELGIITTEDNAENTDISV